MTERLLQFIWQFQYFNHKELLTVGEDQLQIISPGQYNSNQGPDFTNAKIKLGSTLWAGTVELHLKTSDWQKHRHQMDINYENVILHVVWEHDISVNTLPVLELKNRVSKILLSRYEELMRATTFIPCENNIRNIPNIIMMGWKERLLAERLMRKATIVETHLSQNNFHWEETFWWMLARNFGMKVNADSFEAIARSIPLALLTKQKQQIHRLEALLLGQGGLLENNFNGDYPQLLKREYRFLQKKHGLKPVALPLHFLRMRPGNFPTVRLAQLAMLIQQSAHLFSKIKEAESVITVRKWFDVTANDYWHYHYRLDEPTSFRKKKIGEDMIENIIINTVVPVLFAYGNYHKEESYKIKALQWLEETSPELNGITKGFAAIGIDNKSAYDSQGLIELKTNYCDRRMCLNCAVGNWILKIT